MDGIRFRPSERHRWQRCSGFLAFRSALLEQRVITPDAPSEAAWRGTVGHAIVERCLRDAGKRERWRNWAQEPTASLRQAQEELGRSFVCPEDESVVCVVDQELIDAVYVCLLAVAEVMRECKGEPMVRIEHNAAFDDFRQGTVDVVIDDLHTGHRWIVDHKFGKGHRVDVNNNPQLQMYAVLLTPRGSRAVCGATLGITQPAFGGLQTRTHDISEVRQWQVAVEQEITRCTSTDRQLKAGSWCLWCECAVHCPALEQAGEQALAVASGETLKGRQWETVGQQLQQYEDVLLPYIDALRKAVRHQLELGNVTPEDVGWQLVQKQGNRQWVTEDAVLVWLGEQRVDPALSFVKALKSPTQLEKAVRSLGLKLPKGLIKRELRAPTMVRFDVESKRAPAPPTPQRAGLGALPTA